MKRILFESSPALVVLCAVVALAYAAIQYYKNKKQPWAGWLNSLLFILRATLTFVLCFLLLGPIIKQINNLYEKPHFVIVADNSASVKEVVDSTTLKKMEADLSETRDLLEQNGFDVSVTGLDGKDFQQSRYDVYTSDLNSALRRITNQFEGKSISGVILVSDGIYNSGVSPLYGAYNFPVFTVGLGDTTERMDVGIKNTAYNKIAYQGNRFPLRAEVLAKNIGTNDVSVSLIKQGKLIEKQTKKIKDNGLLTFDFHPLAQDQGLQKYDIQVDVISGEQNIRNNRASVFIEVVEGRKKILVVAPSPHPDIKALRELIEKNSNYEFLLHIPGVKEQKSLNASEIDLAIFHQSPDQRGKTNGIFQSFVNSKSSLFIILGQQTDLGALERMKMPIDFEGTPREFDEVVPVVNGAFSNFNISSETVTAFTDYPPVFVHFGRVQFPQTTTPLLFQRVGSVATDKPLLGVDVNNDRKIGLMLGEGFWRWRLSEFEKSEKSVAFDELFGKLIQFLSTTEDKRKFRSYPVKQEFADSEPTVFESQVYNDIFEPVYGNKIDLFITNEKGQRFEYSYVTSPGNIRYQIGGLKEGVYKYRSRTMLNGKPEETRGEFAVIEQQAERQNLTADFDLLRKLASNTGGNFYNVKEFEKLQQALTTREAKSIIHSEETYDSIINLKWVFWVLIALVATEWFLRKYHGSY